MISDKIDVVRISKWDSYVSTLQRRLSVVFGVREFLTMEEKVGDITYRILSFDMEVLGEKCHCKVYSKKTVKPYYVVGIFVYTDTPVDSSVIQASMSRLYMIAHESAKLSGTFVGEVEFSKKYVSTEEVFKTKARELIQAMRENF